MSRKSDLAVARITDIIAEAIAPKEMDKSEALDVLERLRTDLDMQAEALAEEIDDEEARDHENAQL